MNAALLACNKSVIFNERCNIGINHGAGAAGLGLAARPFGHHSCAMQALLLVEWPERGAGVMPPADLRVSIEHRAAGRRVTLVPVSATGSRLLGPLQPD